ncbi:hypothetical protein PNEG_03261 [Pneumocystis murina B123]|uniref:BolA protein n=1 Tax=Pneumocystis murina (strain B123) TaxID=1069680 RepID=M7P3K3_PNEMU|nr:hypothetical protein PNEG_03261 [Pneumocystis murina B123]EMR08425.2 hypothetical protein PNEG_03261 [Pneumocystis murina B123]
MTARITAKKIEQALKERLDAVEAIIQDVSNGCGTSFRCKIVSERFANLNILARHRLVNNALKNEIDSLHAFSQEDYTPEEWNKLKENNVPK